MRSSVAVVLLAALSGPASAASSPVTVFLERDGARVHGPAGPVSIPAFGGGDRVWAATLACVRQHFAPFQIEVVDRRPAGADFIRAVIGGRASQLGYDDRATSGVSPYSGTVLRTATVHVFSRSGAGERDAAGLCAVAAHEVGHALGLDHTYHCGDLMSYFNNQCGPARFVDRATACGTSSARRCANGDASQNSYRRLARLVGLKEEVVVEPPVVLPPGRAPADPYDGDDDDDDDDDDERVEIDGGTTQVDPWNGPSYVPDVGDQGWDSDSDSDSDPDPDWNDHADEPRPTAPRWIDEPAPRPRGTCGGRRH